MKPKKQGQEQAMFNYLDANAKKIIKNVDVLSLILGSLVEDFKEMDEGQLKAYLAPIQNNVKNFSPQVQMQSTELFIGKNKCILDTLFAFNKGKQGALLVDIEMQSTNDYYMELRNVQYCTVCWHRVVLKRIEWISCLSSGSIWHRLIKMKASLW